MLPRRGAIIAMGAGLLPAAEEGSVWTFERLDQIGGHKTTVLGEPKLLLSESGPSPAIFFDGVDDAIFLDVHPLAGAKTFTWEVVFNPASGGRPEQRFFHMQESGTTTRLLLETRLIGKQWCLDSYAASATGSQALLDRSLLHPLDTWHHVAFVYDGVTMRHFVNHQLELSAAVALAPQGPGRTSIGVRINQVDYFRGAIHKARMTRRALAVSEFLPRP